MSTIVQGCRKVKKFGGAYSHLSNKRGGGAKNAKSLNVEVGINLEGGIFQNW